MIKNVVSSNQKQNFIKLSFLILESAIYKFILAKTLSVASGINVLFFSFQQVKLDIKRNLCADYNDEIELNVERNLIDLSDFPQPGHNLQDKTNIKVMMLGLRGFPNVQGGIETHAEHLCPLLAELGCDVTVITRALYQPKDVGSSWKNVKFISIWAPNSKSLEAIVHTFLGVLYAGIKRPDVLHIHAVGPALMTPLARLLGLRVIVTHHGPDYERQKWGWLARSILLLGESLGMRFSNSRIVISNVIRELVLRKYMVHSEVIRNGVVLPYLNACATEMQQHIFKFGLTPSKYVLLVSRLVPEKRHIDLIKAFKLANLKDWKLVLVGASDHPDAYVKALQRHVATCDNVVMADYQTGDCLASLYANAGLFVLPSSHEGLSISLLEALSYGLPVLASNIPANLEISLPASQYFPMGDIQVLKEKIVEITAKPVNLNSQLNVQNWVSHYYNWQQVAQKTVNEYKSALR